MNWKLSCRTIQTRHEERTSITHGLASPVLALLLSFLPSAWADSATWAGTVDGNWGNATNWVGLAKPAFDNTSDITLTGSTNVAPTFLGSKSRTNQSLTFPASSTTPITIRLATEATGTTARTLTFDSVNGSAFITIASGAAAHEIGGGTIGTLILLKNLTIAHDGGNNFLISRPITGAFSVTKEGPGVLQLNAANTFTGGLNVNGGTLGGNGSIGSVLTVGSGGTLQPGTGGTDIATLTVSNAVALSGTAQMVINRTNAQTASRLVASSSLSFGGALVVTNVGPALQAGDTFTLFTADSMSHKFNFTNLPPLGAWLAWNTAQLTFSGVISVVATNTSYLDNGMVKVGIDLAKGGSITYLSKSGTNDNLINNHDLGRQVQQSYYSGPVPYDPPNNGTNGWTGNPGWTNWPWNPIQTGDSYGNPAQILAYANDGQTIYVKCRPMQWALNNLPAECTFESWLSLTGNVVVVSNRLLNARTDTTQQFSARHQELPAVYTIGRLHRLFSYASNEPFTRGALTNFPTIPPPWLYWRATESWAALLDTNNWGLGVYHPDAVLFVGGFAGTPGSGGPNENPTGYMSPLHQEILDSNIEYTYSYQLILGTLTEIRDWVYAQPRRPGCNFAFQSNRQHWHYLNTTDTGWPLTNNRVRLNLASGDPQMSSPACAFYATNVPKIYIRAAYQIANPAGRATAQLFWETNGAGGFSGVRSVIFPVLAGGQWHTYELNLAALTNYSGLITQLRFDPALNGEAGDYVDVAAVSSFPLVNNKAVEPLLIILQTNAATCVGFSAVSGSAAGFIGKNLFYDLESRTELTAGFWLGLAGYTNIAGDDRVKFFTNANSASAMFFRLRVWLP